MNGILLLDKPEGMTSFLAVRIVRAIYQTKKAGHAGTLDPLATGVLPILIGSACGAANYFLAEKKRYEARFSVGFSTDTEDITGTVTDMCPVRPTLDKWRECAAGFLGTSRQIPPMYSALKKDGRPLYELARKGESVEREAREIVLDEISIAPTGEADVFSLCVTCSKGTYIRTLISDLAKSAGTLATMAALRRTDHGDFSLAAAVTLDEVKQKSGDPASLEKLLLPVESAFAELKEVRLSAFYEKLMKNGAEIYPARARAGRDLTLGERVRVVNEKGEFFALGELREFEEGSAIKPLKLFS